MVIQFVFRFIDLTQTTYTHACICTYLLYFYFSTAQTFRMTVKTNLELFKRCAYEYNKGTYENE